MNKYIVALVDNNNNQYGILTVYSGWNKSYIDFLIKKFLIENVSEEEFFENFSERVSYMLDELEKKVIKNFQNGRIEFEYNNCDTFNVDELFL